MTELLELAIEAHGGLTRWRAVDTIEVDASIGGLLWQLKGRPGLLDRVKIGAKAHTQYVVYDPLGSPGHYSTYHPNETAIIDESGTVVSQRGEPRRSFERHGLESQWDLHNAIYFTSYAIWNYLTIPFMLAGPGFKVVEIDHWDEAGARWRRLSVTFPPEIHTHTREQIFYFSEDGLLRRHDYAVDIMPGSSGAHYSFDHRNVDGIIFPTRRRVYPKLADNTADLSSELVTIDLHSIRLEG